MVQLSAWLSLNGFGALRKPADLCLGRLEGPILYAIGVVHSHVIPRSCVSLLRAGLHVFVLSIPLCISMWLSHCPEPLSMSPPLVVFGVNDVYDYESDKRNPPKLVDGIVGKLLHPIFHSDVLKAAYGSTVFIITSALMTGGRKNVIETILLVVLGWQYSSPLLCLKEIPVLDSLSNGFSLHGFAVSVLLDDLFSKYHPRLSCSVLHNRNPCFRRCDRYWSWHG